MIDEKYLRHASYVVGVLFATLASLTPARAAPFSFDATPSRLPKNVVPLNYTIALVPNVEALTLTGTESVTLRFRAATPTVILNSLNETLHDVLLDGRPVASVVSNNDQQLTTVTLATAASIGKHTLTFSYTGKLETQPQGLFVQRYASPHGREGLLLSTQMYSTHARRVFPCWDEPAFRASYTLTVTVPADWATVSNMPIAHRMTAGALATTTFEPSPPMPSYLVEFSAGSLAALTARSGGTTFSVWAIQGREKDGKIALVNAEQILADYNEYFGYRYPLPKLDSIAIPGGFNGAMENWGAITYYDQLLLLTPSSTLADQQQVFRTQAHEIAHQWNGDLVTMGWWDDIWLNESFAEWRAAKETELRHPDWKWWEHQDAAKESAMGADAGASSHAIQQHVTDELQAANAIDPEITYDKGQAVLRMFEAYLGADTFREAIRKYIRKRAFSNATATDLWNELSAASGKNVEEIASKWIEQPGFPLISVAASCDAHGKRAVSLSQSRFLMRGKDTASLHWDVPMQIRSGPNGTPQTLLLTHNGQTAAAGNCTEPLSVNAGAIGFYRAKYDAATLATITERFSLLRDADRIALLDDEWALARAGAEELGSYLALASSMSSDLDTRAWEQIAAALGTIEYDERGTAGHDAFTAYARSIIKPAASKLGWNIMPSDTPDVMELRRTLLENLGEWGDQDTIDEAQKRFSAFVSDHTAIRPDDQSFIFSIVASNANARTFEQLHILGKEAKDDSEQQRYYSALMGVRDSQLAEQAAQVALSPEIPPQAANRRVFLVWDLARQHPALAWATFTHNAQTLLAPWAEHAPLILAQYVPSFFWDSVPLDQLEGWVRSQIPAEMSSSLDRGMETARFRFSEKETLVPAADTYIRSRGLSGLSRAPR